MIRRLRSLPALFFIGLFPVVILLWLWADSRQAALSWAYYPPEGHGDLRTSIFTWSSALHFSRLSFIPTNPSQENRDQGRPQWYQTEPGPWGEFRRQKLSPPSGGKLFPPLEKSIIRRRLLGDWEMLGPTLILPFWLILLCYLPPWLLLAWWQARRRKRKREAVLPVGELAA